MKTFLKLQYNNNIIFFLTATFYSQPTQQTCLRHHAKHRIASVM